ncbi:hypothetical protein ACWC9S_25690 [Streptomyces xiamenensis]
MERLSEITLLAPPTPDAHDFLHALRPNLWETGEWLVTEGGRIS